MSSDWNDHLMTYNKADGSQSISGGHMFITETVAMKEAAEKEPFAHLYEANDIPRKKVIKERYDSNI